MDQKSSRSSIYQHLTLHVMSGTGNSYRVACWMKGLAAEKFSLNSSIHLIGRHSQPVPLIAGGRELVGVVAPTHAFTAPWPALRLAWRLPRGRSAPAFCLVTRGGNRLGREFLCGISGSAVFIIALLLWLKGYRVCGLLSVDLPANWTACYSGPTPENAGAVIQRAKPRVQAFMESLLEGQRIGFSKNDLYDLISGILLFPISVLYLVIGRFFLAKLFFANNCCNGCSSCAQNCPENAIRMIGSRNPRPSWRLRCVSCMRCMAYCPQKAIEAGHSWAVILIFITHAPVAAKLLTWMATRWPDLAWLNQPWVKGVAALAYLYVALVISYAIFHRLIRIPLINAFFTWSTFTRFYRRYHEPGTGVKDLAS